MLSINSLELTYSPVVFIQLSLSLVVLQKTFISFQSIYIILTRYSSINVIKFVPPLILFFIQK